MYLIENPKQLDYLSDSDGKVTLTEQGEEVGGEFRNSKCYGPYFTWLKDMVIE